MSVTLNTGSSQYTNLVAAWPGPGYETDLKSGIALVGNGDGETTEAQSGAPEGTAWKCAAAGAGYSATAPSAVKIAGDKISIVAWVYSLGTPAGYAPVLAVSHNNTGASPGAAYSMGFEFNSLVPHMDTNAAGSPAYQYGSSAISGGTPTLFIAEFGAGISSDYDFMIYIDNVLKGTGSVGDVIQYSATSLVHIGAAPYMTLNANARIWDCRIYSGRLGSTLRAAILSNPNDLYTIGGGGGGSSRRRVHTGMVI